jgi:hypothetical protein
MSDIMNSKDNTLLPRKGYIGESPLVGSPSRRLNLSIRNGAITWDKLSNEVKNRLLGSGSSADVTEEIYNELDELRKMLVQNFDSDLRYDVLRDI